MLALVAVLVGWSFGARAETTATFQVSAAVVPGCVVMGGATNVTEGDAGLLGTLDFGTASVLSQTSLTADTVMASGVVLRCTAGTSVSMSIGGGLYASGGLRHVATAGGAQLAYRLRQSSGAGSFIDINQVIPIVIGSGGPSYEDLVLPVHGVLELTGNLPPGAYTDTLQVTLSW